MIERSGSLSAFRGRVMVTERSRGTDGTWTSTSDAFTIQGVGGDTDEIGDHDEA